MRLNNYILNEGESPEVKKFKRLWSKIESECVSILKIYRKANVKGFFYRGLSSDQLITKRDVLKNRKPKDMDEYTQKHIDEKLFERFKWKPRSEGLFVTGRYDRASEYGNVYAVFPIGDFKFVWSPEVYDLYEQISTLDPDNVLYERRPDLLTRVRVEANGLLLSYKDTDITRALKSGNEVTIRCDKYYCVLVDMNEIDEDFYEVQDIILKGM